MIIQVSFLRDSCSGTRLLVGVTQNHLLVTLCYVVYLSVGSIFCENLRKSD